MTHAITWIDGKSIMLSERGQTQKAISIYMDVQNEYIQGNTKYIKGSQEPRAKRNKEWLLMGMGFLWGWWKYLKIRYYVMVAQLYEYTKNHWITFLKDEFSDT